MANSKTDTANSTYAIINTQPSGTELGYWTAEVNPRDKLNNGTMIAKDKLWFSIREYDADSSEDASDTAVITVSLQYKCEGDLGWQDYVDYGGNTLSIGNRLLLEDLGNGVKWRAGVKDGNYTSGALRIGFDW